MVLKDRIEADFKAAMKSKDEFRLSCLRMVKAAIKNRGLEAKGGKLEDADVIAVLTTLSKRAMESIESFENGGRPELAEKEKNELALIRSYLPAALSEAEIGELVDAAIKESGAAGPRDMGKVMKVLMPRTAGRADGKMVSSLVQERLKAKS